MKEPVTAVEWLAWIRQWTALIATDESVPPVREPVRGKYTVVMFSPHPDDECLVGALPLRLQEECCARVVNVAVTLGHAHQQERRRCELEAACARLDFELFIPNRGEAFLDVHCGRRESDPEVWAAWRAELAAVLQRERPDAVFCPHGDDFHPAHIATRALAGEALQAVFTAGVLASADLFETEFWHPMAAPNLLVGVSEATEARILEATACHAGEVARNPYHLRHPARMIDNVRRGSEVVMGRGTPAARFAFGELYRHLRLYADGRQEPASPRILSPEESLALPLFRPEGGD